MGKIKEKVIEIEEMLISGHAPTAIAAVLGVPDEWVEHVRLELMGPRTPVVSPNPKIIK